MGRRTTLMLVAILVAALGSTLVFLYVQGINDRAIADQEPVEVLTAKVDIAAGESVDDAVASGKLELTEVPKANLLPGAMNDIDALEGQLALAPIFAGEQIVPGKFGATSVNTSLTIPKDQIGIAVEFSDPDRVAGFIQPGSKVAVFACVTSRKGQDKNVPSTIAGDICPGVRLLLKDVEVIGVGATTLLSTTTTDQSGVQTTEEIPRTILTLGVEQEDAEKLIFAKRNGELTLGLMTDESDVDPTIGVYPDTAFE